MQIYFLNTADHRGPRIERAIKDPAYLKRVNKITISLQRRNAGFASQTIIRKCQSNSGLFPCYWTSNSRQILDTISGTTRLRHEKYSFCCRSRPLISLRRFGVCDRVNVEHQLQDGTAPKIVWNFP